MKDQTVELLKVQMMEAWDGLSRSLVGLTDKEFYWQPVEHSWTVWQDEQGKWILDYAEPEPDPPPFTTIGWRLVHTAACKWMYYEYAFGPAALDWDDLDIPSTAQGAFAWLESGHKKLMGILDELSDADLGVLRKTNWGEEWPTWRIFWAMIYHDMHHGAEISCLRDLHESMNSEKPDGR
jgi:hypothetical protein